MSVAIQICFRALCGSAGNKSKFKLARANRSSVQAINKGLSFVKFTEYAAADLLAFAVLYHHGFAVDIDGLIGVDDKFELVRARVYLFWYISEKYRFWRALRIKRGPLKLAYEGAK
ncbi:hypothetical protein [Campylobacter showae]|uniref:hypothetical protein n=1 Tax=Campylobacter showae TaxID=204 RepID=UPI0028D411B6|nr:hypothetical protein [Campylobacter showae]